MNTIAELEKRDKWKALTGTLLFHGAIVLLFFLMVFTNPDPPLYSDNAGMEVNFGTSDDGMGDVQPEPDKTITPTVTQQKQQQQTANDNENLTQDDEEAPEIAKKTEKKVEQRKTNVIIEKPKKEEPKPVVDPTALYKKKSKGNEGETNKAGDQGIEEGTLYAKNHGKNMGTGDHGDGTGRDGTGGNGDGKGFSFSLDGRGMRTPPRISDQSQEQGKVVIDITVDKYGNVVSANGPGRGSTTTSSNLVRKAKEAAMKTKFSASAQGVEEQRGTITFVFILR